MERRNSITGPSVTISSTSTLAPPSLSRMRATSFHSTPKPPGSEAIQTPGRMSAGSMFAPSPKTPQVNSMHATLLRTGISKFNHNADKGVKFLLENDVFQNPHDVAVFLRSEANLSLERIGEFLGGHSALNLEVLRHFGQLFDFTGMSIDEALRIFLARFRLPGEAQKIDRIMETFAKRFCESNPKTFASPDSAFVLAFSIIMLNTDAHNPSIKRKMTCEEFIRNCLAIPGTEELSQEALALIFERITKEEIKMNSDRLFATAVKQGFLRKRAGNGSSRLQRRWFMISANCLFYYARVEDSEPRALIPLEGLHVEFEDGTGETAFGFRLFDPHEHRVKVCKVGGGRPSEASFRSSYDLFAESEKEREEWVDAIRLNVIGHPLSVMQKKRLSRLSVGLTPQSLHKLQLSFGTLTIDPVILDFSGDIRGESSGACRGDETESPTSSSPSACSVVTFTGDASIDSPRPPASPLPQGL